LTEIRFILEPASSGDDIGRLWRRLEQDTDVSFFVSWTWIGTWLRCLPECVRPQLLTATRGGAPVGAAILVPRRERRRGMNVGQLHFNSTGDPALDCIWIEHNGFVASAEEQRELWPAFLNWFARQPDADELLVPRASAALIDKPPAETKLLHATYPSLAFRSSLLPGGLEAILGTLSANTRQQMRRSLRACEALGALRCESSESVGTALAWFGALKAFHMASWARRGKPHGFRYPFAEQFHRALIGRGVPDGSVQLLRISAGTTALGYLYNFRRGGTVLAYQSGFDDALGALRPGYVSHVLALAASAAGGAARYDFLAGENQLKHSLGSERYALFSHRIAKPRLGLRLEAIARSTARRFGF
jgi:CelD/BcsL family acetyltransferase involved in cellulose biosynthesis